jgi:hypothetical protein
MYTIVVGLVSWDGTWLPCHQAHAIKECGTMNDCFLYGKVIHGVMFMLRKQMSVGEYCAHHVFAGSSCGWIAALAVSRS